MQPNQLVDIRLVGMSKKVEHIFSTLPLGPALREVDTLRSSLKEAEGEKNLEELHLRKTMNEIHPASLCADTVLYDDNMSEVYRLVQWLNQTMVSEGVGEVTLQHIPGGEGFNFDRIDGDGFYDDWYDTFVVVLAGSGWISCGRESSVVTPGDLYWVCTSDEEPFHVEARERDALELVMIDLKLKGDKLTLRTGDRPIPKVQEEPPPPPRSDMTVETDDDDMKSEGVVVDESEVSNETGVA